MAAYFTFHGTGDCANDPVYNRTTLSVLRWASSLALFATSLFLLVDGLQPHSSYTANWLSTNIAVANLSIFIPFGLFFYLSLYLWRLEAGVISRQQPMNIRILLVPTYVLMSVACGMLVSVSVEFAQVQISGRSPHADDLLLNTLGAGAGTLLAPLPLFMMVRACNLVQSQTVRPSMRRVHPERSMCLKQGIVTSASVQERKRPMSLEPVSKKSRF